MKVCAINMTGTLTIYSSENDCIVRIASKKPDASSMRLLIGGKPDKIVIRGGAMYYRDDDWGLPLNHAATTILEGEESYQKIYGNVVIVARNGLLSSA